jgi:hypothetical protein
MKLVSFCVKAEDLSEVVDWKGQIAEYSYVF